MHENAMSSISLGKSHSDNRDVQVQGETALRRLVWGRGI